MLNGTFMLGSVGICLIYDEPQWKGILIAVMISIAAGLILRFFSRNSRNKDLGKREGYLIVTLGWIALSISGSLPYILTGAIPSYADAFFETMSGYTTTGATILNDIEVHAKGILFWRSLTHWIGGMGIIVLTVAILPILGIGGMQLFIAESPGPTPDKLHPRITETAKRLWFIYIFLTFMETVLLVIGGMSLYEAVNHSMATMATGGFSVKNASIAHYDSPFIQYVIIVFMFLAGANFTLNYLGFKGKFARIWKNEEFRTYFYAVLLFSFFATISVYLSTDQPLEKSLRDAMFQVVSIVTTTGFVTADYTSWASFLTILFFILFFTGGCTGSTAGGIKIMRHLILIKNSLLEVKRQIHPSAVIPVRFNKKAVSQNISYHVSAFVLVYLIIFFLGSLVMALLGLDFMSALGSVTSTLGNIGPGLGTVGPVNNFAHIPVAGKWVLSFLMLLGRLELFTVLILVMPHFWKQ